MPDLLSPNCCGAEICTIHYSTFSSAAELSGDFTSNNGSHPTYNSGTGDIDFGAADVRVLSDTLHNENPYPAKVVIVAKGDGKIRIFISWNGTTGLVAELETGTNCGTLELFQVTSGSEVSLGTFTVPDATTNEWHTISACYDPATGVFFGSVLTEAGSYAEGSVVVTGHTDGEYAGFGTGDTVNSTISIRSFMFSRLWYYMDGYGYGYGYGYDQQTVECTNCDTCNIGAIPARPGTLIICATNTWTFNNSTSGTPSYVGVGGTGQIFGEFEYEGNTYISGLAEIAKGKYFSVLFDVDGVGGYEELKFERDVTDGKKYTVSFFGGSDTRTAAADIDRFIFTFCRYSSHAIVTLDNAGDYFTQDRVGARPSGLLGWGLESDDEDAVITIGVQKHTSENRSCPGCISCDSCPEGYDPIPDTLFFDLQSTGMLNEGCTFCENLVGTYPLEPSSVWPCTWVYYDANLCEADLSIQGFVNIDCSLNKVGIRVEMSITASIQFFFGVGTRWVVTVAFHYYQISGEIFIRTESSTMYGPAYGNPFLATPTPAGICDAVLTGETVSKSGQLVHPCVCIQNLLEDFVGVLST